MQAWSRCQQAQRVPALMVMQTESCSSQRGEGVGATRGGILCALLALRRPGRARQQGAAVRLCTLLPNLFCMCICGHTPHVHLNSLIVVAVSWAPRCRHPLACVCLCAAQPLWLLCAAGRRQDSSPCCCVPAAAAVARTTRHRRQRADRRGADRVRKRGVHALPDRHPGAQSRLHQHRWVGCVRPWGRCCSPVRPSLVTGARSQPGTADVFESTSIDSTAQASALTTHTDAPVNRDFLLSMCTVAARYARPVQNRCQVPAPPGQGV